MQVLFSVYSFNCLKNTSKLFFLRMNWEVIYFISCIDIYEGFSFMKEYFVFFFKLGMQITSGQENVTGTRAIFFKLYTRVTFFNLVSKQ